MAEVPYIARCGKPFNTRRDYMNHEQKCDNCKHAVDPNHPPELSERELVILEDVKKIEAVLLQLLVCPIYGIEHLDEDRFVVEFRLKEHVVTASVDAVEEWETVLIGRVVEGVDCIHRLSVPSQIQFVDIDDVTIEPGCFFAKFHPFNRPHDYVWNRIEAIRNRLESHIFDSLTPELKVQILTHPCWKIEQVKADA